MSIMKEGEESDETGGFTAEGMTGEEREKKKEDTVEKEKVAQQQPLRFLLR